MSEEHPKPTNDVEKRVNDVIDDLTAHKVTSPDRSRLRDAIDKADHGLVGRDRADHTIGHSIFGEPASMRDMRAKAWMLCGAETYAIGAFITHGSAFEAEKPGTPECEHFNDIASRLKEIEADRLRDIQAANLPDPTPSDG